MILISGHPQASAEVSKDAAVVAAFLWKPLEEETLVRAIERALGTGSNG